MKSQRIRGEFSEFLDLMRKKAQVVVGQGNDDSRLVWSGPNSITFVKDEKTFNWVECIGNLSWAVCRDFLSHPSTTFFAKTGDKDGLGSLQRKIAPLPLALVCAGLLESIGANWQTPAQAQVLALFIVQGTSATIVGGKYFEQVNNEAIKLCKRLMLETEDTRDWAKPLLALTREAMGKSLLDYGEYVIMLARFTAAIAAFYETLEYAIPSDTEGIQVSAYSKTFQGLLELRFFEVLQLLKSNMPPPTEL